LRPDQMTAAASIKTAPSATSASPGQFDLIPKPVAGLLGSNVSIDFFARRKLPLSWPRRSGWIVKNSTPPKISSAPIHMRSMATSSPPS
jgi:hypothetical protein